MDKVFISYRRNDSGGFARAIYQHLVQHFGSQAVFMDLETLEAGSDFAKQITAALADTKLVLVLIGKDWLGQGSGTAARVADPNDFVRLEVALALRGKAPIIPVLVGDAELPREADLPDDMRGLLSRNAVRVTHARFAADIAPIVAKAEEELGEAWWVGKTKRRVARLNPWLRTPTGIYVVAATVCGMFALTAASGFVFERAEYWTFYGNLARDTATDRFRGVHFPAPPNIGSALLHRIGIGREERPLQHSSVHDSALGVLLVMILLPLFDRDRYRGQRRALRLAGWGQFVWIIAATLQLVSWKITQYHFVWDGYPEMRRLTLYGVTWLVGAGIAVLLVLLIARRLAAKSAATANVAQPQVVADV